MTSISISPPPRPPTGVATPPGSKSHTIRALFAAAGAAGESTLVGALDSEDTRRARECLRLLGVGIEEIDDVWRITGVAGEYAAPSAPLDAGESGLTARFLMGLAPFVPGPIEVQGRGRLSERPMAAILENLRERGARVTSNHPWRIDATAATRCGSFSIDGSTTSQMVSALLLAAPLADAETSISVHNMHSSAEYVSVTVDVMRKFGAVVDAEESSFRVEGAGYQPTIYKVPVDASSCAYPACAAAMTGGRIEVLGDPGVHPDRRIFDVLRQMGASVEVTPDGLLVTGPDRLDPVEVDMSAAPDAAVALAVACSVATGRSRIDGLASLRLKESDRLGALEAELAKFGTRAMADGDSLVIDPGTPRPARFATHNDHRIAMSLSLLGLITDGIVIDEPSVVDKTWPGYWNWLASTGAIVRQP